MTIKEVQDMATNARGTGQSPANVTRFLKGIDFPAQKKDLIQQARKNQADQDAMKLIQNMEEREYDSMADVMKVYGQEPHGSKKQEQQQSKSSSQTKGKSGHAQHR
jgi:hypothetical protein